MINKVKRTLIGVVITTFFTISSMTVVSVNASEVENDITNASSINAEHRAELREIWDDYMVDNSIKNPLPNRTSIGGTGDILMALDSITDHVGIVVDSYTVIEAHPDNPNEGVDYRDNNWTSRYNHIKGIKVDNATSTQKSNAVSYADDQIGDEYSLTTTHWTEDKWYCSKLVWRAWYEQGYDIEGRTYEARGTHVTPGDILDSPLTSVFYTYDT